MQNSILYTTIESLFHTTTLPVMQGLRYMSEMEKNGGQLAWLDMLYNRYIFVWSNALAIIQGFIFMLDNEIIHARS